MGNCFVKNTESKKKIVDDEEKNDGNNELKAID